VCLTLANVCQAQICGNSVPSFTVDLTGNPDSIWTSTSVSRNDTCCGAKHPDRCIKFVVTLDKNAYGIKLDLIKGALPTGALFYQVSCGTKVPIGNILCLSGVGPHTITFCKPGSNKNTYQITSVGKPDISGNIVITEACSGLLAATGYIDSTIRWTSTPFDSLHNTFLSCVKGCDTTYVNATYPFPDSVYYKVCGSIGGCASLSSCDSAKVEFVTDLVVDINPDSPQVCFGMGSTPLTGIPSGGKAPYYYEWRLIDSTLIDSTQVIQGEPGKTYVVKVLDSTGCSPAFDTVYVDSFSAANAADAGLDRSICKSDSTFQLNGGIQIALGGQWSGGTGSFTPNDSTLNAVYKPSVAELTAGTVTLKLTTTGNHKCPADSDYVIIDLNDNPVPSINGDDSICIYSPTSYSTTSNASSRYAWSIRGGVVQSYSLDSSSVTVVWNDSVNTKIWVTETNVHGCTGSDSIDVYVFPRSPVSIIGGDSVCANAGNTTFKGAPYYANSTYNWSISRGVISAMASDSLVANLDTTTAGFVTVSLFIVDSLGCNDTATKSVRIDALPDSAIYGPDTLCELTSAQYSASAGTTHSWAITNGTITSGSTSDTANVFWPINTNSHTLNVTIGNQYGCLSTGSKNVILRPKPDSVIIGPDTVCELSSAQYVASAGTAHSWAITNGTITSSTTNDSINVFWPRKNTSHLLSVTISNQFGCTSSPSLPILINAKPDSTLSGPDTVCELTRATYVPALGSGYTWTIVNGGGVRPDTIPKSISVFWPAKDTAHSLSVIIGNQYNCNSTASKIVTVIERPDSVISGLSPVCENSTALYSVSSGNTYSWSAINGSIISGTGTDSIQVRWPSKDTAHSVSISVQNFFGCSSAYTKDVVINTRPDSVITGPDTLCELTTAQYVASAGASYSWSAINGTISAGVGTDTIKVQWPRKNTNHSLAVTVTDANGCTSQTAKNIFINEKPDSVITGPDTLCELTTAQYIASTGATYSWSIVNGTISAGTGNDTINVQWPRKNTNHSISVTVTDANGCASQTTKNIFINEKPDSVITGPDTLCELTSAQYIASSGATYSWSIVNGTIGAGAGTDTISVQWPRKNTNHSLAVTVTDANGCISQTTKNIFINEKPDSVITGPDTLCELTTAQYIASPGASYSWSISNGTISAGVGTDTINVQWPRKNTAHGISVTVTGASGCTSQTTKNIFINEKPDSVITGPDTLCELTTAQYIASSGASYSWSIVNGTIKTGAGTDTINVQWPRKNTNHSLTVIVTDANGCTSQTTKNIFINGRPDSIITGPDTLCELTTAQYIASAGTAYSWSIVNGTIGAGTGNDTINVQWPRKDTAHSISVTITDANGCTSQTTKNIFINGRPDSIITGPDTLCELTSAQYIASSGATYSWSIVNGTISAGTGNDTINVQWPRKNANHSLAVTVTDANGCTSQTAKIIFINEKPDSVITGPDTLCELTTAQYIASSGTAHTWSIVNGTISAGAGNDTINVQWPRKNTNHSLTVIVTDANGCTSQTTKNIFVNEKPDSVITGPDTLCELTTAQYIASPGATYTWSISNGTISTGTGNDTIQIQWPRKDTAHSISVTVTDVNGCTSQTTKNIFINEKPDSVITGPDTLCELTSAQYIASIGATYSWSIVNGTISAGTGNDTINVQWPRKNANHSLAVTVADANGCTSQTTKNIFINEKPDSVITGPDTLCELTTAQYIASPGATYTWSIINGTISAGAGNDTINVQWPRKNTAHGISVTVTDANGCTSQTTKNIFINEKPDSVITGPDTLCELTSAQYIASIGATYSWSIVNGTISAGTGNDTINVQWPRKNTNHSLAVTVTDANGCTSQTAKNIFINEKPDSVITGPDTLCELTTAQYIASPSATYTWSISNGTISAGAGNDTINVQWPRKDTAHSLAVTVTDINGCTSETTKNIFINSKPDSVIKGLDTICELTTTQYVASSGISHSWTITNGSFASGTSKDSITVQWPRKDTGHLLNVTITNQYGCISQVSKNVFIHGRPDSVITGPDTICELTTEQYVASVGTTHSWTITNGSLASGSGNDSITVQWPRKNTSHSLKVSITNQYGCTSEATKDISIKTKPDSVITGPDTLCELTTAQYFASTGTTHSWAITNGYLASGIGNDSISVDWPRKDTSHLLNVTISNQYGCTSKANKSVFINGRPDSIIIGPDTLCELTTAQYVASSGIGYSWSIINGIISTGAGNDTINAQWPRKNTAHSISVTVTDANGCSSETTKDIFINAKPDSVITGPDTLCELTTAPYVASVGTAHSWVITNGTLASGTGNDSISVDWPRKGTSHLLNVTISNQYGCTSKANKSVFINGRPDSIIIGPDTLCELTTAQYIASSGTAYSWSIINGTISAGVGTDTINVQWPRKDTAHSISITVTDANGCSSETTKDIFINIKPDSVITGPDTLCELTAAQYAASLGTAHSWNITSGTITGSNTMDSINVFWPRKDTVHLLNVTISNQFGCASEAHKRIFINERPDSIITGPDTTCELSMAQYVASTGTSHSWNITNGIILSGTGKDSITVQWPEKDTTHQLRVAIINNSGCISQASKQVYLNSKPDSLIFGPDTLCMKSSAFYSTSTGIQKSWSVLGGTATYGPGEDSITIYWPQPGNHKILVSTVNQHGCESHGAKDIVIYSKPDSFILGPDTVCELSNAKYSSAGGVSHQWSIDGGSFKSGSTNQQVSIFWPRVAPLHSLEVVVTNSDGCSSKTYKNIFVKALPIAIINGIDSVCINGNETLEFESANQAPDYSYTWLGNNVQIISGAKTAEVKTKIPDIPSSSLALRIRDGIGCVSDTTHKITGLGFGQKAIEGRDSICTNEVYDYQIADMRDILAEWTVIGGNILSNQGDSIVTIEWDTLGSIGLIAVKLRNRFDCDTIISKSISKLKTPDPIINGPHEVCAFENSLFSTPEVANTNYTWGITGGDILNVKDSRISVKWSNKEKGHVSLELENTLTGCRSKADREITIHASPIPKIIGKDSLCSNERTTTYTTPNDNNTSYTWSIVNGKIDSLLASNKVKITWTDDLGFIQLYAINNRTGCDTTLRDTVNVISTITAAPLDTELCELVPVHFGVGINDPNAVFTWDMGDGSKVKTQESIVHQYRNKGTYEITVIANSFKNCWDTLSTTITIHEEPQADFIYYGSKDPVWEKEDTVFFIDKSIGAVAWEWNFHDSLQAYSSDTLLIYDTLGSYSVWLIVTSENGCKDSMKKWVEVAAPVTIFPPNAFSPNGDNVNDYFYIPSHHIEELNIKIFNRWGERIYESNDPDFRWDGTFKEEVVQDDVYIWIVSARTVYKKKIFLQGSVKVIK